MCRGARLPSLSVFDKKVYLFRIFWHVLNLIEGITDLNKKYHLYPNNNTTYLYLKLKFLNKIGSSKHKKKQAIYNRGYTRKIKI